MTSLIRQLFRDKTVAAMLLVSSFFIGVCALAPSLFVIIVLNKFLASGVTATLVSLAFGAVLLLAFELAFRQNRSTMIQEFNQKVFDPFIKMVKDRLSLKQITGEQFKKVQQNANIIKATTSPGITGWVLDWPFTKKCQYNKGHNFTWHNWLGFGLAICVDVCCDTFINKLDRGSYNSNFYVDHFSSQLLSK